MTNWLEHLYDALGSEYGIAIQTNDSEKAKQALYRAIRAQKDPSLENLTIRTSPKDPRNEIWIMKKGKPNGALTSNLTEPTE